MYFLTQLDCSRNRRFSATSRAQVNDLRPLASCAYQVEPTSALMAFVSPALQMSSSPSAGTYWRCSSFILGLALKQKTKIGSSLYVRGAKVTYNSRVVASRRCAIARTFSTLCKLCKFALVVVHLLACATARKNVLTSSQNNNCMRTQLRTRNFRKWQLKQGFS